MDSPWIYSLAFYVHHRWDTMKSIDLLKNNLMIVFQVSRQEKYSRIQLLIRLFLGPFYIVLPHFLILIFVLLWTKVLWIYATFYILLKGSYPSGAKKRIIGTLNWVSRLHLTVYNLRDDYPEFGIEKRVDYFTLEMEEDQPINRLSVLFRFILGWFILIPNLLVWSFRNFLNSLLAFVAFWRVLFTGEYPSNWFDFQVGTLRWLLKVLGYQLYLEDKYPSFSGKE